MVLDAIAKWAQSNTQIQNPKFVKPESLDPLLNRSHLKTQTARQWKVVRGGLEAATTVVESVVWWLGSTSATAATAIEKAEQGMSWLDPNNPKA